MTGSILVVEDDTTLAQLVSRNLAVRDYQVRTAGTVAAAVEMLDGECPDLVLIDIDMPDASGWEVVRVARHRGCLATRVVVMSALLPNRRLVKELSCVGVLEKPFPMEALVRLVAGCLQEFPDPENGAHGATSSWQAPAG